MSAPATTRGTVTRAARSRRRGLRDTQVVLLSASLALVLGCGAEERAAPAEPPAREAAGEVPAVAEADPPPEEPREAPSEPPEEPPPPEVVRPAPIELEPGVRMGPVRLGMSEEDLRALGLEESTVDPRTRRFGPYHVTLGRDGVQRVEARMGDLGAVVVGGRVLEAGTHIHALRDAIGGCEWQEGGGERYRCADGGLWVETTHTLDPLRYTLRVER